MELSNILSNVGCGALSDSIDFADGIKKAGPIALKIGAIAAVGLAMQRLYCSRGKRKEMIFPNCVKWDGNRIRFFPKKTREIGMFPQKDKKGKMHLSLVEVTRSPIISASDALIYTAMLAIASVATYALANSLEQSFQTSSNYFGCKA